MEAVRNLKANLKLDGKPCGWCQAGLKLGDDAAVCTACEKEHHSRCWDGKAGCSTAGCVNAPLRRLDAPTAGAASVLPAAFPMGLMACPQCRSAIPTSALLCPTCRAITSPDGLYHGPKMNAPGAVASLVFGIVGLLFCGVIFGPVAISKSSSAKRAIASDPTLTGGGLATAGMVLGILDLVCWALVMMMQMGRH
jgi:hypothetical protein